MPTLQLQNLRKGFQGPDGTPHPILDVREFQLGRTEQAAIQGVSGSGKSTLLHLAAGILPPDGGNIILAGRNITQMPEAERDRFRARHIGIVFQTFNLLQGHTVLENVLLGMAFGGAPKPDRARSLLERVGLGNRLHHRPRQLSSGQQQRVAVARALASHPSLVLADEPTGNLDPANATEVLRLLRDSCHENEAALLLVSHDPSVLGEFERVVDLEEINQAGKAPLPPQGGEP